MGVGGGAGFVRRLRELGADVSSCPRGEDGAGDPCVSAFHAALDRGALPFGCQGNDNALTIDGGKTLGYELAEAETPIDALFIQVGGGALASSCVQALADARRLGVILKLPRIHAVQTQACAPLARAHDEITRRLAERLQLEVTGRAELSRAICEPAHEAAIREELQFAAAHRSQFMTPVGAPPKSIARGILDDEVYDWHAVVEGMLLSGGYPVEVDEATLRRARDLAHQTESPVCATGSAGLAGLLKLGEQGGDPGEQAAVLFTGRQRQA